MKTLLLVVIDRSGSMEGRQADVVGGVNTFIAEQKKIPDPAVLAMVRFDDVYEEFRPAQILAEVAPLHVDEYHPRGGTALLDAIGRTLNAAEGMWVRHKPDRAIMVIVTDGQENCSKDFRHATIKQMVESREASKLWSFVYLGSDLTTFTTAAQLGIPIHNTTIYTGTAHGTRVAYMAASASVSNMRSTGSLNAGLGGALGEDANDIKIHQQAESAIPPSAAQWAPPDSTVWAPPGTPAPNWAPPA